MAWALVVVSGIVAALLSMRALAFRKASLLPDPSRLLPAVDAATPPALRPLDWSIFRGRVGSGAPADSALSQRFRLAGTFFELAAGGEDDRVAILDDLAQDRQLLVREKDDVDGVLVVQIQRDRVILRDGDGKEAELTLTFTGGSGAAGGAGGKGAADGAPPAGRFGGNRVGEGRWTFNRAALLRYYQDLRDQPERLVQLFDSLKPVYTADNRISGYRLGVEGEREFFDAVGLSEGDVVRRVNNVEMTNRRRAEFFVSQFVRNDANAFVLDVERGGTTNRLVYEVR
ncbi:MAG: hypothetical protein K8T26_15170 [Lentisphaerae bacterium]|nr:hypothetical protein [Lentisphaerota bacterium]